MLRQRLRILGSEELRVVWKTDIDETLDRVALLRANMDTLVGRGHVFGFLGGGGVLEGCVLDGVAVDFADVHVFFDGGDFGAWNAVGCAPDFGGCGCVLEAVRIVGEVEEWRVVCSLDP